MTGRLSGLEAGKTASIAQGFHCPPAIVRHPERENGRGKRTFWPYWVTKRKKLIVLSNHWNRTEKPRFLELECDAQGNILKQRSLRGRPAQPRYHEVWGNDEARTDFASFRSFRRK